MISRLVGAGRWAPEAVQDELPGAEPVVPEPANAPAEPVVAEHEDAPAGPVAGSSRLAEGTVAIRYAGAMLLHAFFDRVGAHAVFAGLTGADPVSARSRRFDDVALLTATSVAFALGVGSVEATKHLIRDQVGPLAGLEWLPELRTLRPRLDELPKRVIRCGCKPTWRPR
jgi:hypothetical protein